MKSGKGVDSFPDRGTNRKTLGQYQVYLPEAQPLTSFTMVNIHWAVLLNIL